MKTVAIIQARMGSTRLPGKVMKTLCGRTVLAHVIRRVRACPLVDEVVVATTRSPADDAIAREATGCGAGVFRGSEDDVLSRYYLAALERQAATVVRITSDCPLFDPKLLEEMLRRFLSRRQNVPAPDYLSNSLVRTYPRGLDAEILTFQALEKAWREGTEPYQREHVTPYIYQHPELFVLENYGNAEDLSFHRWTLDTDDDFRLIAKIYAALGREDRLFSTDQVLDLLRGHPAWLEINAHVRQKELGQ